ncbi:MULTISPECIES: hypothetical protein [Acinetobacter]|jgi:hypothetical protein|uniref:hypothetical protein n=1 Tax=Acinetobacter TaxID=469 RepID=UPI0022DFE2E5|nr:MULTISPECIES: hypothetical protein [Acinetobacter]MDI1224119.1 hypothetical protein [Acinetobacter sp.]
MKNKILLCITLIFLIGCDEKPSTSTETKPVKQETSQQTHSKAESIEIAAQPEPDHLVNNPTPLPQGYSADTTYLKKPLLIDFDGDGKLDAFQVLKNPNKKGMKYLFEFRISDSDKVYYYQNNEEGDDLDIFAKFEVAPKTNIYVDEEYHFGENGDILANEQIDPKHYLKFKGDGVSVNVLEETCAASAFFLTDDKIKRIYLC